MGAAAPHGIVKRIPGTAEKWADDKDAELVLMTVDNIKLQTCNTVQKVLYRYY
jgi:hypothetical protein